MDTGEGREQEQNVVMGGKVKKEAKVKPGNYQHFRAVSKE
jgi:hypothetical protein